MYGLYLTPNRSRGFTKPLIYIDSQANAADEADHGASPAYAQDQHHSASLIPDLEGQCLYACPHIVCQSEGSISPCTLATQDRLA